MVSTYNMQPFYRQTPLTVDTTHAQKFFDEEDSILDDNILEHSALDSGLEMSPPMVDSRRDSFVVGASLFSPKNEWQSVEMESVPSNNPFLDSPHSNNPFMRMDQHSHQHQQPFGQQGQWSMASSAAATPLPQYDGLPGEFEAGASLFQQHRPSVQAQTPFANAAGHVAMFTAVNGQSVPAALSQQQQQQMQQQQNAAGMARRRPQSPAIRSHNELRRGDGIRKKNARFDIPAERNLNNIDQLIAQSTDEQEIKELKQQKRLLRNRQAALDSRQRKKLHTERLEDEKKQYTVLITDLEEQLSELKLQVTELMEEKKEYTSFIEKLNFDKEEMIRQHTIETGDLRKKISVLTNHVQTLESQAMSASSSSMVPPSHAGYPGGYGEMEGLTMDSAWESMTLFNDFPMEQQQQQQTPPQPEVVKQEMQLVPASSKKSEGVALPSDDKPAGHGGFLFMLFLVGAFVLSSRQTPAIPRVSEDVRAASATLLENVLKDAGVAQSASGLDAMAPQPSGTSSLWAAGGASSSSASAAVPTMSTSMSGLDNGVAPSMLAELSDSLTQPTEEQTNEQLFSLSAAQYDGVASQDFLQNGPPPERSTSQGRKNLAEALSSMRDGSKAEVYTRSLLWDQIPSDVVRTFVKMVADCNTEQTAGGGSSDT